MNAHARSALAATAEGLIARTGFEDRLVGLGNAACASLRFDAGGRRCRHVSVPDAVGPPPMLIHKAGDREGRTQVLANSESLIVDALQLVGRGT